MDHDTSNGPGDEEQRRLRIGDAEREEVLNALQEHLAAGRLDIEEYEQRAERVVAARYAEDLAELLDDLPQTAAQRERAEQQRAREEQRRHGTRPPYWQGRLPFPVPLMIGLAVLAIVALPGPPFLLFPLFWAGLFFLLFAGRRSRSTACFAGPRSADFSRHRGDWRRWEDPLASSHRQVV